MKSKKKIKYIFIILFLIIISVGGLCATVWYTSSAKKVKKVKNEADNIVEAVKNNDAENLINIIYGLDLVKDVNDDIVNDFIDIPKDDNDVIKEIINRDEIEIKKIKSDSITYTITAPDLSGIVDCINENIDKSDEEFLERIKEYIRSVDTTSRDVTLKIMLVDEKVVIDYKDEMFIDAITGGMYEQYKKVYLEMMEEYK